MAASEKCPRCDCEGNRVGCEICYYYAFNCPGNCACCEEGREATAQIKARKGNKNNQRESTQKKVSVCNCQREPVKKVKRTPFRPLILRNVKKSLVESQKKASSQSKEVSFCDIEKPKSPKVNAESQTLKQTETKHKTPKHETTDIVESPLIKSYNEFVRKDNEAKLSLFKELLWPRYIKAPCEPSDSQGNRVTTNITSKEQLEEGINSLIGDHCLNCHCKNPRDPCEVCKQSDYQCLGTCLCCLPFRAGQRYIIFVTRGLYRLPNGSIYGGGNISMSSSV